MVAGFGATVSRRQYVEALIQIAGNAVHVCHIGKILCCHTLPGAAVGHARGHRHDRGTGQARIHQFARVQSRLVVVTLRANLTLVEGNDIGSGGANVHQHAGTQALRRIRRAAMPVGRSNISMAGWNVCCRHQALVAGIDVAGMPPVETPAQVVRQAQHALPTFRKAVGQLARHRHGVHAVSVRQGLERLCNRRCQRLRPLPQRGGKLLHGT